MEEWGGVENWIFNMAQLLSKNHKVTVISNGLLDKKRVSQIPLHSFKYIKIPTFAVTSLSPSIIVSPVPSWLNDFDVIYLYHNSLLYTSQILAFCNSPVIVGVHSELVLTSSSLLMRNVQRLIFYRLSKHASKIVCRSKNQVQHFQNFFAINPAKIKIERPFVNTAIFYPSVGKDHFTALFVGRFVKGKGIFTLQESIKSLTNDYRWIFVGSGEKLFESIINDLSNSRVNVHKKGFLTGKSLTDQFAKASVLVNPSESESFPNVVLQSLACGTPVILSDIPAHRELAEMLPAGTYSIFSCGNSEELESELLKWRRLISTDLHKYEKICCEARDFIEKNFSQMTAINSFETLLRETVK